MGFSTDKLKVESSDGRSFALLESFSFTRPNGEIIIVPVGSRSDGASPPEIVWDIVPPFGSYWIAAYLHDYLYRYTKFTKDYCDEVFKEAMESLNVEETTRDALYEGVKFFGWSAFREDRTLNNL